MIRDVVIVVTSPIALFIFLAIFPGISTAINASKADYSVLKLTGNAASEMGLFFIVVLALTFIDFETTCALLVSDRLLQFEFVVIAFYSLTVMAYQYVRDFDAD